MDEESGLLTRIDPVAKEGTQSKEHLIPKQDHNLEIVEQIGFIILNKLS